MELQDQVTALKAEVATLKNEVAEIKTQLATKAIDWREKDFQMRLAVIQGKLASGMLCPPKDVASVAEMITKEVIESIRKEG